MEKALVGYTGFVGSNIYAAGYFDAVYNSKNIEEAYGTNPDILIYAGLRAEKYLANNAPEKDMGLILQAEKNITEINPKKLVLISTIDVFKTPRNVDEAAVIDTENLHTYGYNRYQLELWVREKHPDALVIRLPGLFGKNIKKNFIYDYINVIPYMLRKEKMAELSVSAMELQDYYELQDNGYYKCKDLSKEEKEKLRQMFTKLGFTALDFTDSRNEYQFYPLSRLWEDIQTALDENIPLLNMATEPVSAAEVYKYITGKTFQNELDGETAKYDFRTRYAEKFGGKDGYICSKEAVLEDIKRFIESYQ